MIFNNFFLSGKDDAGGIGAVSATSVKNGLNPLAGLTQAHYIKGGYGEGGGYLIITFIFSLMSSTHSVIFYRTFVDVTSVGIKQICCISSSKAYRNG